MVHHSTCPLCSGSSISEFYQCTDYLVTGDIFSIYRCNDCSFVFTQDAPSENEAGVYYNSPDYISHTDSRRTILEKTYQFVRSYMLERKKNMVLRISDMTTGSLLDIGSGTGHFMNTMKKAGWKTAGVEINREAREHSERAFNLEVYSPDQLKVFNDDEFDCITLWHAAEHLYDLYGFFSEIRRVLKPDGAVIVALPNNNSYDAGRSGKFWAAWDVPRHLWHFTPLTFSKFAAKTGLAIRSKSILPFDVFYISILSEKNRKGKGGFLTGILNGTVFYLATLFRREKASSVVYILNATSS